MISRALPLFLLLLSGRLAFADETALVIVQRVNQAEDAALELVKATAINELAAKGWHVKEAFDVKLAAPQVDALAQCIGSNASGCLDQHIKAAPEVTRVLMIRVKAGGPINGLNPYELLAFMVGKGTTSRSATRYCAACSAATLETLSSEVTKEIFLDAAGTGMLEISSDPAGVTVRLDGEPVGVTPLSLRARAGDHVVSFSKEGYAPTPDVKVAVEAGGLTPVSRTLAPLDGGDDSDLKPSLAVPISLMALGVGAIGVGTYFVITGGPAGKGETEPKTLMRTPGLFIAGGGVVLAGVGTFLLVRELRKKSSPRESAVTFDFSVGPGGMFVGTHIRY